MTVNVGVVMDAIQSINPKKDSTLAMLLEAQDRQWNIFYFEQKDLFIKNGAAFGIAKKILPMNSSDTWYRFQNTETMELAKLNVILMRKDPPVDAQYLYTTYILEKAEALGTLILNKPQSLRNYNEKIFATSFPQCCPPTLVTTRIELLEDFLETHKKIVVKPLNGMGGSSIFVLTSEDANRSAILNTLTNHESVAIMAQQYLPEITSGDKRIILINGHPIPYALARIPQEGDWRGNLALGAKGVAQPLTTRDIWICEQIGETLRKEGLYFVGIDVIGDYLTEINVTSPTGIRELDSQCDLNISALLLDFIESKVCQLNDTKGVKFVFGEVTN